MLFQQWSNQEAQRQFNEEWEEKQRLFDEKWKEFTRKDELMWRKLFLLQDEQFYEDRIHRMFTDYLEHPAVKALIEKNKTKIHDLKDALGAEGERFGTLLRPSSSLGKMKLEENHSDSSEIKEENQEGDGSIENLIEKPAVSNNLEVKSANQSFSPPGTPAMMLEKTTDGVSTGSTKDEIPDFSTTKQETFRVSCDTKQPPSLEETAEVSTPTLEKSTEGASLAVIYEEVPTLLWQWIIPTSNKIILRSLSGQLSR
jgi:hypothetical protein